jgi:hypothetical protein
MPRSSANALLRTLMALGCVCLRCFAVALHYARPAQDAISASVPIARLTDEREREIVEALRTVGDKASRVVRSMLLKHQSMPS